MAMSPRKIGEGLYQPLAEINVTPLVPAPVELAPPPPPPPAPKTVAAPPAQPRPPLRVEARQNHSRDRRRSRPRRVD